MSERYSKVYTCSENLYTEGAPVVLLAGALLKDNETGKMIAQLKFCNISEKPVTYVKLTITQLDAVNNLLDEPATFEYLDLTAANLTDFGAKKPLPLSNSSTRAFKVGVCTVGFADGTTWTGADTDWKPASKNSAATKVLAAFETYNNAVALLGRKKEKSRSAGSPNTPGRHSKRKGCNKGTVFMPQTPC